MLGPNATAGLANRATMCQDDDSDALVSKFREVVTGSLGLVIFEG